MDVVPGVLVEAKGHSLALFYHRPYNKTANVLLRLAAVAVNPPPHPVCSRHVNVVWGVSEKQGNCYLSSPGGIENKWTDFGEGESLSLYIYT